MAETLTLVRSISHPVGAEETVKRKNRRSNNKSNTRVQTLGPKLLRRKSLAVYVDKLSILVLRLA
jgi:hypothetical protein